MEHVMDKDISKENPVYLDSDLSDCPSPSMRPQSDEFKPPKKRRLNKGEELPLKGRTEHEALKLEIGTTLGKFGETFGSLENSNHPIIKGCLKKMNTVLKGCLKKMNIILNDMDTKIQKEQHTAPQVESAKKELPNLESFGESTENLQIPTQTSILLPNLESFGDTVKNLQIPTQNPAPILPPTEQDECQVEEVTIPPRDKGKRCPVTKQQLNVGDLCHFITPCYHAVSEEGKEWVFSRNYDKRKCPCCGGMVASTIQGQVQEEDNEVIILE